MKSAIFTVLFSILTLTSFAQNGKVIREEFHANGSVKLQFVQVDKKMVQATYFHDNGLVAQKGYFLNEELYGYWETFDYEENKIASGFFSNNKKTGTWNYWVDGELKHVVSYSINNLAQIIPVLSTQ